jgi:hypothetical protein
MEKYTDIYERAIVAMPADEIDHYNSDLYLKVTEQSKQLVSGYEFAINVTRFSNAIDGTPWFEVPFAYTPAWTRNVVK